MLTLFATLPMLGCILAQEDTAAPTDLQVGMVSPEDASEASTDQDGEIDTGFWTDTPDEDTENGSSDGNPPDPVNCSAEDLLFVAEIEDGEGTRGVDFSTEDDLFFIGRTVNPCDGSVTLTTANSCLVQRWEIKDSNDITYGLRPDCLDEAWDWRLEPGDELIQSSTSRQFSPGDYTLTVRFSAEPYQARQTFTIQ